MSEDKMVWRDTVGDGLRLDSDGDFHFDGRFCIIGPRTDAERDECIANLVEALGRPWVLADAAAPVEQYPWAIGVTYDGYVIAEGRNVPDDWEARDDWKEWVAGGFWVGADLRVCRPKPAPTTERVPAWEAWGRKVPNGETIHGLGCLDGTLHVYHGDDVTDADADGMVEVLPLDGEA